MAAMSVDESPEFAGFEATPSTDAEEAVDVRPADAEVEENTTADESRDPDHGYDPMSESGSENAPEDEVGPREDAEGLLAPGSTAEGAGTALGADAIEGGESLGENPSAGTPGQLADERWRTNGINPLG
ncbi:hypothetical protein C5C18_10930 [Rathayibacter tritici]|nr:hypothetical protein C5C06_11790 [Rathayibacter tritici]PPF63980.1 hypothetical protein C5C21_12520 [Rathayibacter tritici]PPG06216.1 hypothetical protein C5C18_10930 [Rathayibacter tritici]PPI17245.1 hypothetical protein C5D07_05150 [Rathayibacter tritici]